MPGPDQPLLTHSIDRAISPILKGLRHSAQRWAAGKRKGEAVLRWENAGESPLTTKEIASACRTPLPRPPKAESDAIIRLSPFSIMTYALNSQQFPFTPAPHQLLCKLKVGKLGRLRILENSQPFEQGERREQTAAWARSPALAHYGLGFRKAE